MHDRQILMCYVTCPDQQSAQAIAQTLLTERLIACVNLFTSRSNYVWEGSNCTTSEVIMICKTAVNLQNELEKRISVLHAYDTPCILFWTVQANAAYDSWVYARTQA